MRTKPEIRAAVDAAILARLNERQAQTITITEDTGLADTGLDSLDVVEIWLELEEKLGWEIPEADIRQAKTVRDLVSIADSCQPKV